MGSAASNQNRVASAGLSREDHQNLDIGSSNDRPQSSSPAHSKSEQTYDLKLKKKAPQVKTEVTPFSPKDLQDKKTETSPSHSNNEQQKKIRELELQLAKSESQKLDLLEQLNGIKQKNALSKPASLLPPLQELSHPLPETVQVKDQHIVKLEKDLQAAQKEAACMRQKLKKRIKALTSQLHEVRQEASINQMELKAVISQQNETIEKLKNSKDAPSAAKGAYTEPEEESGHSKIIVELSNQLTEQADHISSLEAELAAKDQKLRELEEKSNTVDAAAVSTDRLPSGRGKRTHKNNPGNTVARSSALFSSETPDYHRHQTASTAYHSHEITPVFEHRKSTALSDSDSDWELESVPSKIHSAPAGARVKSAVSVSSSVVKDDVASMQGNDDSILNTVVNPDKHGEDESSSSHRRTKPYKKSSLRTHLEKKKNVNQTSALIGPSLAFATKSKEPPSDTSCEPTPRCADRSHLPGFPSLHVVNSVSH